MGPRRRPWAAVVLLASAEETAGLFVARLTQTRRVRSRPPLSCGQTRHVVRHAVDGGGDAEGQLVPAAAASALLSGNVATIPDFVCEEHLADLRENMAALAARGAFVVGESFSSDGTSDKLRSALTW